MDKDRIHELLTTKPYHFAKTMPQWPHYYTRRREWGMEMYEFDGVADYIEKNGVIEFWNGQPFTYYYFGGYKYWNTQDRILINRAEE